MTPKQSATATLTAAGIKVGTDFDALTQGQRDAITSEAKLVHKAKYAGEMTDEFVRKRYDLLQQRARS